MIKVVVGDKVVEVERLKLVNNVLWGWRNGKKFRVAWLVVDKWTASTMTPSVAEIDIREASAKTEEAAE